ncbi:putative EF-hand domain-containing protein [Dioscorea sansibarensis]
MECVILISLFSEFLKLLTPCRVSNLLREVLPSCLPNFRKIWFFSYEQEKYNSLSCCSDDEITDDDIKVVIEKVGMIGWRSETTCEDSVLLETVLRFLEEKEASMEELEEAFYVFDRQEDGFIDARKLWSVLRRLGFKDNFRLEDCERMISVFDQNGDGKINFSEFRNMLENVS